MTYEETPSKTYKKPKQPKQKKDTNQVNKDKYKTTIANYDLEIKKLKLLKKQAKITYKLTQMKASV